MMPSTDYTLRENDPGEWLQIAEGLMLSAAAVWEKLLPQFAKATKKIDAWPQVLAYWPSFLLLTGYAFENLYRAALRANGIDWRDALKTRAGHGLTTHVASITTLDDEERNLISRLETYITWAGRYNVPKYRREYDKDVRNFKVVLMSSDLTTAQRLFARIRADHMSAARCVT